MKYNDLTIQKLRELSILEVADKLGFKLKGLGDEGRRALCPYHDDKHPSLHFSKKKGIFKCFVCGAKGDLFKLVMDDRNCTFPEACEWLINEFHVVVIDNCPADCSATLRSSVEEMKEIKEIIFCGTKRLKVVIDAMNTVIKDVISIEIHKDSYL